MGVAFKCRGRGDQSKRRYMGVAQGANYRGEAGIRRPYPTLPTCIVNTYAWCLCENYRYAKCQSWTTYANIGFARIGVLQTRRSSSTKPPFWGGREGGLSRRLFATLSQIQVKSETQVLQAENNADG